MLLPVGGSWGLAEDGDEARVRALWNSRVPTPKSGVEEEEERKGLRSGLRGRRRTRKTRLWKPRGEAMRDTEGTPHGLGLPHDVTLLRLQEPQATVIDGPCEKHRMCTGRPGVPGQTSSGIFHISKQAAVVGHLPAFCPVLSSGRGWETPRRPSRRPGCCSLTPLPAQALSFSLSVSIWSLVFVIHCQACRETSQQCSR